ncbi:hypothetical protein [Bacteroides sp.]
MLVIHPKDKTTTMLSMLYTGLENVRLLDQGVSNAGIKQSLHHMSSYERIMLLGHGSDSGLFSREDDSKEEFDRVIVSHAHAYYLRRHGGNIVGIWCNANLFAQKEGLHGLFSGMIISEMSEAAFYGISTEQEELDVENVKLATRLRSLFDEDILLSDIPQRILTMDDVHTPLTEFNYKNFYYL